MTSTISTNMTNTTPINVTSTVSINSDNKKITCEKNNCVIDTVSLVIAYLLLLLVVISIGCYCYFIDHRSKTKMHCCIKYKMNRVNKINIKNRAYYIFDDMIQIKPR